MTYEEALRKNREAEWDRKRKEIKRNEDEYKRDLLLTFILGIFILAVSISFLYQQSDQAIDNCIKKGFARNVCIANLD